MGQGDGEQVRFPLCIDLELRVARAEHPLVEESPERPPAYLLERAHQIPCLHDAEPMRLEVATKSCEEAGIAEEATQHVQHQPTLFVQVPVEEFDGISVVAAHQGSIVASARLRQILLEIAEHSAQVRIRSEASLPLQVLEVGSEALIEPGLRPVAAGDEIPKPMVGQLVRDQILHVDIEPRSLVQENMLVKRGGGGVFHAPEDEVRDHDLRVALVGVFDSG